jgi:hypothetical protein
LRDIFLSGRSCAFSTFTFGKKVFWMAVTVITSRGSTPFMNFFPSQKLTSCAVRQSQRLACDLIKTQVKKLAPL